MLSGESKHDFLILLRREVSHMAAEELRGTDWTVDYCPYLEYWFHYYGERSPGDIEAALRRYAPGATTASTPAEYVPFVVERVRRAIRRWRETGEVDAPAVPNAEATPEEIEARFPDAKPLPSDTRTRMEGAFDQDFESVRIHAEGDGLARAGETSARALTVGSTIVFGSGQFEPGSTIGDLLLAHELAHTQQQSRSGTASSTASADEHQADQLAAAAVARTRGVDAPMPSVGAARGLSLRRCNNFQPPAPEDAARAVAAATPEAGVAVAEAAPDLDEKVLQKNKVDDFFVAESNGQMVALPATNLVYELLVKPTEIPAQNFFGVPTADKEGVRLVNIGGRESFLIESGGKPVALMPEAVRLLKAALNVGDIVGINTLHIHEDHIRNLVSFIIRYNIKPEGLRFPRAFTTSGMRFASIIQQLQTLRGFKPDQVRRLKALGYGKGAATPFTIWDVPATPKFGSYRIGDKLLEEYGDPQAFARLARGAQDKPTSQQVDAASVIYRITDIPSGKRVVVFSDPRGATLNDVRTAMGDKAFGEIFEGVTVISGFQHHTGALHSPDHEGLIRVLSEILARNGQLTILEQSTTAIRGGRGARVPFMNASLVEALRQLGVTHIAALAPAGANNLGAVTVDRAANVQTAGGSVQTSTGDASIAARFQRFTELGNTIRLLKENVEILGEWNGAPIKNRIIELEAAHLALGRALGHFRQANGVYDGLIQLVMQGVGTGQAQGTPALTNQSAIDAKKASVLAKHAGEAFLDNATNVQYMQWLAIQAPLARSVYRQILDMRRTGQVTEKLIRDMILLDPELARRLLDSGNVTRQMRDLLKGEVKNANDYKKSAMPRTVAKGLLAMTVWNEILVPLGTQRQMDKETELNKFINVVSWWRQRGVKPSVDASDNYWFDNDTRSNKPRVVNEMISQGMIDHLVLTSIDGEENWDQFNIWIATNVHNLDDFVRLIRDKPARWCSALRMSSGDFATATWEYRAGTLSADTISDYTVTEKWVSHPRLNIIMNAMATRIMANTEQELADAWTNRNAKKSGDETTMLASRLLLRRVKFKASASDRKAYTIGKQSRVIDHIDVIEGNGWWSEPEFYVLPASEDPLNQDDIGSEYLLVTGANWDTYAQLTTVYRVQREMDNGRERKVNLRGNPRGMVLIKKSSVEDF